MPRIDISGTRQPAGRGNWLAWLAVVGFAVWLVSRRESSPVIPIYATKRIPRGTSILLATVLKRCIFAFTEQLLPGYYSFGQFVA